MEQTMSVGLLASSIFYRFTVIYLFSRMTLPYLGILVIQRGLSRIKPSWHVCSSWWFLRLVSLCSSLNCLRISKMNGLPCMAMSIISLRSLKYISSGSMRKIHGVTFKNIIPTLVDFSLSWSCISLIWLILQLNTIIERSLLLLSFLIALTPRSPLRSEDLYWVRLAFPLSPWPYLLLSECQPGLVFYPQMYRPPCIS